MDTRYTGTDATEAIEVEVVRTNVKTGVTVRRRVRYSATAIAIALRAVREDQRTDDDLTDLLILAGLDLTS